MRTPLLVFALIGVGLSSPVRAGETVYLDGPRALAQLEATNPNHYARVQRILAAANHLCRPGPGEVLHVAGSRDEHCAGQLLLTSNPPQWRLSFRLDDTRYVALVVITDDAPRLRPANCRRSEPRGDLMCTRGDRR